MPTIRLIDPQGVTRDVDVAAAATALEAGWRQPTQDDDLARVVDQAKEETYGGAAGAAKAAALGALRGVTVGGSDAIAAALSDNAEYNLRAYRDVNPGLSTGAEIVGIVAPALATGGAAAFARGGVEAGALARAAAATPAGAIARLGSGITGLGEGAGLAGRLGAATAGGIVEGGLYGAGTGVTELALSDDPVTLERAASVLSSNMLYGAATGGAAGAVGKAAEIGILRAKGALDTALERRVAGEAAVAEERATRVATATDPAAAARADVSALEAAADRRGLEAAARAELDVIEAARVPERQAFVEALQASRDATKSERVWQFTEKSPHAHIREIGKQARTADVKVRALLDNRAGLSARPERALDALQRQDQALELIEQVAERELSEFRRAFAEAPDTIRAEIVAGKMPGYIVGKGGLRVDSPLIDEAINREIVKRFGALDEPILPNRLKVVEDHLADARGRNWNLRQQLAKLTAEPTSERLAAIEGAKARLSIPKEPEVTTPSLGRALLDVASPFAGGVGALGALAGRAASAIGGLKAAAGKVATRAGKIASEFLDVAAKGTKKIAPRAPVLASKVLASVSFGADAETRDPRPGPGVTPIKGNDLADLYGRRTAEIRRQVHIAPDGSHQMRPDARAAMAERLRGIAAVDPLLADRIETAGARRIAYLASIMPRLHDFGTMRVGPERRQVSDLQMRSFARSVWAVENPIDAFERLITGQFVPEYATALKAVHPEMVNNIVNEEIVPRLATLRKTLPPPQRLALSVLTGMPVEPSMAPGVLRVIQGMYATEPGTAGGTQAPMASPQFGSISREQPTAAQQRQGDEQ